MSWFSTPARQEESTAAVFENVEVNETPTQQVTVEGEIHVEAPTQDIQVTYENIDIVEVDDELFMDYNTMTKKELMAQAAARDLPVKSSMKKQEIIDILSA